MASGVTFALVMIALVLGAGGLLLGLKPVPATPIATYPPIGPYSFLVNTTTISNTQYFYSYNTNGRLVYGGPLNIGGISGTNASLVLQNSINSCGTTGHITLALGCKVFIKDGDYPMGNGQITCKNNETVIQGESEFATQLDWGAKKTTVYMETNGCFGFQVSDLAVRGNATTTNSQGLRVDVGSQFTTVTNFQTINVGIGMQLTSQTNALQIDYGFASNLLLSGDGSTSSGTCIGMSTGAGTGDINGWSFYGVHCTSGHQFGVAMSGSGSIDNDHFYALSIENAGTGITIADANALDDVFYPHYDSGVGGVTTPESISASGPNTICEDNNYYTIGGSSDTTGNVVRICVVPAAITGITAGASVWTYTDLDGYDQQMIVSNANGITAETCNGIAYTHVLGTSCLLHVGGIMTVTWAVTAPTYTKVPMG